MHQKLLDDSILILILIFDFTGLAATLNSIFASPEDLSDGIVVNWMDLADIYVAMEAKA